MYEKIYDFCKVRNRGSFFYNTDTKTPRVLFLENLLKEQSIEYYIDTSITQNGLYCYNIVLPGSSNKMVVAHHDIANPYIDNANDNSASVINAIMVKKLMPDINVVLLDGEEVGGVGASVVSKQILSGNFGEIDWVLNLELSGYGGEYFFMGEYPGKLFNKIREQFDCPSYRTPFNDSVIFRKYGIDSVVINPLPILKEGYSQILWRDEIPLDYSPLYDCHTNRDTVSRIITSDMKDFTEKVVCKILE
jgi:hypothetical protein